MDRAFAVVAAARLFALMAIGGPALWFRAEEALVSLGALTLLWVYQAITTLRRDWELTIPPAAEAAIVGVICAIGMEYSDAILCALAVPPLFATAVAGLRTMIRTVLIELVTVICFSLMWWQEIDAHHGVPIFTWIVAGVGVSLVSSYTFTTEGPSDAIGPYHDAQHLIGRLIELSGNLTSGLDVTVLSGQVLALVGDRFPNRGMALYVPRGDTLYPVASSTDLSAREAEACQIAAEDTLVWGTPLNVDQMFAFRAGDTAIVAGRLPDDGANLRPDIAKLRAELTPTLVQLDTALLFSRFRDLATADERQRLAREMHDGVAQDIASLGYLVDAIAMQPANEQQAEQLRLLRERLSKVVGEVRESVMNLRTNMGDHESLGAAISAVARHLSEASGVSIQVRLDEHPARLRHEIEAELFRITQEAMNNAVKHSRANRIDVHCEVYAPDASITVSDDGVGLQRARTDSHGMKIMRERARMIGADLSVTNNSTAGLTVSVSLSPLADRGSSSIANQTKQANPRLLTQEVS